MKILTPEYLKKIIPSAFAERAHSRVSTKYVFVPTSKITQDLAGVGWFPVEAYQSKSSVYAGFQKHMIKFANPEYSSDLDVIPNLILINGHNALTACKIFIGYHIRSCMNGLVTGDVLDRIIGVHLEYSVKMLYDLMGRFFERIENSLSIINKSKVIEMKQIEINKFVMQAAEIRFNKDMIKAKRINMDSVQFVRRPEDDNTTLWSVYNRIQENIIKGGIEIITNNGRDIYTQNTKPITEINKQIMINVALWNLMKTYIK